MLPTDIGKVVFRFPDDIITPECPQSGISNGNVQTTHDCCQSTVGIIVGEFWVDMGVVEALVQVCDIAKPGGPQTVSRSSPSLCQMMPRGCEFKLRKRHCFQDLAPKGVTFQVASLP